MNIYVGNLEYKVKDSDLEETFRSYGEVSSVRIVTDKFSGRSKGYGFVEMPNDAEASNALNALNGKEINGRAITVSEARPRTEGGGGGGERRSNFRRGPRNSDNY